MSRTESDLGVRARTGVGIVLVLLSAMFFGPWTFGALLLLVWVLGAREAATLVAPPSSTAGPRWGRKALAILLWAVSVAGLAGVGWGNGTYAPELPLGWFVLIWLNDTGAYFAGRAFGRHKLAPSISPGKTWEGWFGGMVASVLAGWVLSNVLSLDVSWWALALVVSVLGPAGDLTQSALKRRAGVKDSGQLLPGHGGILDRFDSHIFAAPLAAILLRFF